ncbi:MAG: hypothetical protein C5B50_24840 [Verrucomicrobia bacterium]|nr:MAG: hypothetical protein C5B50_24840 [Verrucomicrobiota bacterium]
MITVGSITREQAANQFEFLAEHFPGRRSAIRELTHGNPEFVFWIFPNWQLHDAKTSHRDNVPRGYQYILKDEPDYCGFLRGRVVRKLDRQLVVVYCRNEALANTGPAVRQFVRGLEQLPIPVDDDALIISDNGDIYGTLTDLFRRAEGS